MRIYHIIPRTTWEQALARGVYSPASISTEGFIHASTAEQVADTGNRYYHGQPDLLLLVIDSHQVKPEVRLDPVDHEGKEMHFPHIYGPLNLDAVVEVFDFLPDAQGNFHFPGK